MKFDIPLVATVEAKTIEEARQMVYSMLEKEVIPRAADLQGKIILDMADDSCCNANNQRLVFLHPEDVPNNYDVDLYHDNLKMQKE